MTTSRGNWSMCCTQFQSMAHLSSPYVSHVPLSTLVILWKAPISFVMSVCLSVVRPSARNKSAPTAGIFMKFDIWEFCTTLWIYDKNNGYFIWRPTYIFYHISLHYSHNGKFFDKYCRENRNTHFTYNNVFFWNSVLCEIRRKYIDEPDRKQMRIWRMSIANWISKATNTIRMCNTNCFSTATVVVRRSLFDALYLYYLHCYCSQYDISPF